ncbi:energy-coupling factor ABC transporter permease [bacterium]|nr:energy-coupling factor ABC transporter permease [bacterium]
MHITEGIIRGTEAIAYTAAGVALMAAGAARMKAFADKRPEHKPLLGMGGAFIFFVSLIPIPAFTGTCSHPCGSPLAGILLGPVVGIGLTGLSLLLQAAFFAHGGFSTWGANLITLGIGGAFFGWLTYRILRAVGLPIWAAAGGAGLVGDVMTYVLAGLSLGYVLSISPNPQYSLSGYLVAIYSAYLPTQGPIAIGEMVVTGLALHYIYKQRPEVLQTLGVIRS